MLRQLVYLFSRINIFNLCKQGYYEVSGEEINLISVKKIKTIVRNVVKVNEDPPLQSQKLFSLFSLYFYGNPFAGSDGGVTARLSSAPAHLDTSQHK